MKIIATIIILLAAASILNAQNVGIGTSSPQASALLHVNSTNKGFLMPRMTSAQRSAIAAPVAGLMVYDTDRDLFYHYNGSFWLPLLNSTFWSHSLSGNYVYNTTDSIGIGTISPDEKLQIVNGQILLSRSASYQNQVIFDMPASTFFSEREGLLFKVDGVDKAFIGYSSNSSTPSVLRLSGDGTSANDLTINSSGNVGIGTGDPGAKLHVSGDALLNATNPTLQLQNAGVDKGFVQLSGDDLRLGTNSSNSTGRLVMRLGGADRVYVEGDGKTGIGEANPQARLHVNSGSSIEALRLTGNTNAIMRFMTGATEKAFLYATGNHLSIGTAQAGGQVRINNELYVDDDASRVGVGTTVPDERLHVNGNIKTSTAKVLNNAGENLLPLGFATFAGDGTKLSGTSNITGGWINTLFVLQSTSDLSNVSVVITMRNARMFPSWTPYNSSSLDIRFYDTDGDERNGVGFSVVVYKAN